MDSNFNLQLNNYIRKHSQQLGELYNAVNIISNRLVDLEKSNELVKDQNKRMELKLSSMQETFDSLDIEETVEDEDASIQDNEESVEDDVKEVVTEPKKRGRKKKTSD
jgi:hypothetical protein